MPQSRVTDREDRSARDLQLRLLALCLDRPRTLTQLVDETRGETRAIRAALDQAVADRVVQVDRRTGTSGRYAVNQGPVRDMVATLLILDHETRRGSQRRSSGNGEAA